ncbi:MAG: HD domain-containing phosphohydrolase [Sulfurimonadaceae bacterium]
MSNTSFQSIYENMTRCEIQPCDYQREFDVLESTMLNMKHLKPMLHRRMNHTGNLFQFLLHNLSKTIDSKVYSADYDYVLASFYCNIGFVALETSLYKSAYVTEKDIEISNRHIHISANLLTEKKLYKVADIVHRHHEKPDGSGVLRIQNTDKKLALLNIADVFIDSILPSKKPEVALMLNEAIEFSMKGYTSGVLMNMQEQNAIVASLISYYQESMR